MTMTQTIDTYRLTATGGEVKSLPSSDGETAPPARAFLSGFLCPEFKTLKVED